MTQKAGGLIDVADFGDTGWVDATGWLAAGRTSTDFAVRRVGAIVCWVGIVTPTTDWGAAMSSQTIITAPSIPEEFRPTAPSILLWAPTSHVGSTGLQHRLNYTTGGGLTTRCNTATNNNGVYVNATYFGAS